jgi:DNA-binding NtrC family response regulator
MGRTGTEPARPHLAGVSCAIREILALVETVAQSDCPVLIEGESGTGKELVARRIHTSSPRAVCPFIPVNCAGVSETLFESQFFGHIRGSFTGAEQTMLGLVRSAEGGTLFLDEVGEIPANIQPKLLRVLQDGEVMPVGGTSPAPVNTRFVAATNRSLRQEVGEGRFRQDLYYRMNVVRIEIPPLRTRPEDVPVLADHFLAVYAAEYRRPAIVLSEAVCRSLAEYGWPGNVRELASWVERLYATGLAPEVAMEMLLAEADALAAGAAAGVFPGVVATLEAAELAAIRRALAAAGNNQLQAARLLNIHRSTLARKLREYNVA